MRSVRQVQEELEVTGTTRVLPEVIGALAEQHVIPEEVRTLTRSLEDVFVDLVQDHEHQEVSR